MSFVAAPWLPGPNVMTIYGSLVPRRIRPGARERWTLPDGDFLDVDRTPAARPDGPMVIACHGLEGSSHAGYIVGLGAELAARGVGMLAFNFRGCSGESNRLARFYHSGETGNLDYVVARLVEERPGRALGLAGFSLGGNVVTKYLGERGARAATEIRAAAVVSVPFDLAACARTLDGRGLFPFLYRERFLRRLRKKALEKAARFPAHIDAARVRAVRTLSDFDEAVTAPLHGFAGARDYWTRSSSGPFVAAVARPLLVLHAEDDPLIPAASLPLAALHNNSQVELRLAAHGGHVAFVSGPPWRSRRWAESTAAGWLAARLA